MRRYVVDRVYIVNLLGVITVHVYAYRSHMTHKRLPATMGAASMLTRALGSTTLNCTARDRTAERS